MLQTWCLIAPFADLSSLSYGLLYALFPVFPIICRQLRGFNDGETGLVFLGVGIGTTLGTSMSPKERFTRSMVADACSLLPPVINMIVQWHYKALVPAWHGHPPPEERLYGAMLAGPFLIIGIFWLGWTGK